MDVYVSPHPEAPTHLPPYLIPPGCHRHRPWVLCFMNRTCTGQLFSIWEYTCFNANLSNHPTLAFSHQVQKSVLYICFFHIIFPQNILLYCFQAYKIAIFKKIFDMSISRGGPDAQWWMDMSRVSSRGGHWSCKSESWVFDTPNQNFLIYSTFWLLM